jgi:hypothetical protein
MKYLFKVIICFFLGIFIIISVAFISEYIINTKYTFPEPHTFRGNHLYNPYQGMDSTKWRLANFHVHTRLFFGITNGAPDSNKYLDSLYKYFGYNIIGISNYQSIDTFESKNNWFVPVYEHGYQYYKNHQLVLNAKKVSWLDYVFRQTLSNKQFVIDHLKKDTSVILTIVHPSKREAYSFRDFKYLSNYNCLEIANNIDLFTSYYDTILSSGHPVFIMADDDAHDLTKISEGCHSFNLINSDLVRDSILHALKTGRSVGVNFNISSYKTNEEKKAALKKLPEITSITLKNDTFTVRLNEPVDTIKFIGYQGKERERVNNCAVGVCLFSKEDTYLRTEIKCYDGTIYFLNPVFRYNGVRLIDQVGTYNAKKTWAGRSVFLIVILLIFLTWKHRK